jgi:hypothetical protein
VQCPPRPENYQIQCSGYMYWAGLTCTVSDGPKSTKLYVRGRQIYLPLSFPKILTFFLLLKQHQVVTTIKLSNRFCLAWGSALLCVGDGHFETGMDEERGTIAHERNEERAVTIEVEAGNDLGTCTREWMSNGCFTCVTKKEKGGSYERVHSTWYDGKKERNGR